MKIPSNLGAFTILNGPNNRNGPGITGRYLTFSFFLVYKLIQDDDKTIKVHLDNFFNTGKQTVMSYKKL